jgi:hypothetical protein
MVDLGLEIRSTLECAKLPLTLHTNPTQATLTQHLSMCSVL